MTPAPRARATARTHAERSQATREHLVATAIDVVRERSVQGATVFEVAKAAGVTPGALQHHFGSKAVLMRRVIDEILRASDATGVAWPDPGRPLAERAEQIVRGLWQRVYEPPRFLAAWSLYFGCSSDTELCAYMAGQRAETAAELRARFAASFPELAGAADADAFVDLVLSSLRGIGVARVFDPEAANCAPQLRALADLIVLRCRGGATPTPRSRKRAS